MLSLRSFGSARGRIVLGLALGTLMALPPAARADDNNNWDWKSSSNQDENGRPSKKGDGGWVAKDDAGNVRVYTFRRNQAAATGAGYLGVQVQDVTRALMRAKDLKTSEGALVNDVEDGSPAGEAGLRRGDVIIALNGKRIGDSQDLIQAVRDLDPGDKARVEVERNGARQTISVTIGERQRRAWAGLPPGMGQGRWRVQGDGPGDSDVQPQMMRFHQEHMDELNDQLKDLQKQIDQLTEELRGLREDLKQLDSGRSRTRDRDDRND